jgi:hypothetical protein
MHIKEEVGMGAMALIERCAPFPGIARALLPSFQLAKLSRFLGVGCCYAQETCRW